jgi:hypothetical protein
MASLLRHVGLPRATVVLSALMIAGVALLGPTGATAGPAFTTTTPFPFSGSNPCTGELLEGTGQLHFLLTSNESGNVPGTGNVQFHLDTTISGLQAVTTFPIPGKKYVVINEEGLTDTFDSDVAPFHQTVEHTFQLVRSGEDGTIGGDDFYEKFLAHFTVNANGIVTVDDFTLDPHCK